MLKMYQNMKQSNCMIPEEAHFATPWSGCCRLSLSLFQWPAAGYSRRRRFPRCKRGGGREDSRAGRRARAGAGVEGIGGGGGGALQVIFHASRNSYGSENDREESGREREREDEREREGESGAGSMTGLKLGPNGRTNGRARDGWTDAAGLSSRPSSYSKSQNEAAAAAGDTNVRF